jgi:hypothetical protein
MAQNMHNTSDEDTYCVNDTELFFVLSEYSFSTPELSSPQDPAPAEPPISAFLEFPPPLEEYISDDFYEELDYRLYDFFTANPWREDPFLAVGGDEEGGGGLKPELEDEDSKLEPPRRFPTPAQPHPSQDRVFEDASSGGEIIYLAGENKWYHCGGWTGCQEIWNEELLWCIENE